MPLSVTAAPAASPAAPAGPARTPSPGDGGFADVLAGQVDDQLAGPDAAGAAAAADRPADPSADPSSPDDAEARTAEDGLVALDAAAIAQAAALPAPPATATGTATATATAEPPEGVARSSSRVRHGWSFAPTTAGTPGTATAPTPRTAQTPAAASTPAAPSGPTVAGTPATGPTTPSAGAATPLVPAQAASAPVASALTASAPDGSRAPVMAGTSEPAVSGPPPMQAAQAAAVPQQGPALPLPVRSSRADAGVVGISADAVDASNSRDAGTAGIVGDNSVTASGPIATDGAASATPPATHAPHSPVRHPAGIPLQWDATGSPAVLGPGTFGAAVSTATGAVPPGQVAGTGPRPAGPDAPASGTAPSGVPSPPLQAISAPPPALPTAAPVAPPSAPAPPLVEQLVPRLVEVPGLGEGVHRLTLDVRPEAIGSVTVVAHIRADSVRIELVGATAAAHEALRGVLDDLRRDLAATGSSASLDLGTATGSSAGADVGAGTGSRGERPGAAGVPWLRSPGPAEATPPVEASPASGLKAAAGRVDVLA